MKRAVEELKELVRQRICRICTDWTVGGECGRDKVSSCALLRFFPQVAGAVQSTESEDIRDYIRAIRENVCAICPARNEAGDCQSRWMVECALDAYLLLIIDVIEECSGNRSDSRMVVKAPKGQAFKCATSH